MIAWLLRLNPLLVTSLLVLSLLLVACSSSSNSSSDPSPDDEQTDVPVDDEEAGDEEEVEQEEGEITPPFGVSEAGAGFRVDFLELQHPHVIIDTEVLGTTVCEDATFDPFVVTIELLFGFTQEYEIDGLNPAMQDMVNDLSLNLVQILDPLGMNDGDAGLGAVFDSECESETSCVPAEEGELGRANFTVSDSGACLADVSGIHEGVWPDGRSSDLNTAAATEMSCYVSENTSLDLVIDFLDDPLVLSLQDVRIGARFGDDDAMVVEDGLIIGFLTEGNANQVDIEVEGMFFNLGEDLLPSDGPGDGAFCSPRSHCAGPDARVSHNGECGWWFALNFTGLRLEDVSGF